MSDYSTGDHVILCPNPWNRLSPVESESLFAPRTCRRARAERDTRSSVNRCPSSRVGFEPHLEWRARKTKEVPSMWWN